MLSSGRRSGKIGSPGRQGGLSARSPDRWPFATAARRQSSLSEGNVAQERIDTSPARLTKPLKRVGPRGSCEWIGFYNTERPHSALAGRTPAEAYGAGRPVAMMDKAIALATSPQAQQQQHDVINRVLAA